MARKNVELLMFDVGSWTGNEITHAKDTKRIHGMVRKGGSCPAGAGHAYAWILDAYF